METGGFHDKKTLAHDSYGKVLSAMRPEVHPGQSSRRFGRTTRSSGSRLSRVSLSRTGHAHRGKSVSIGFPQSRRLKSPRSGAGRFRVARRSGARLISLFQASGGNDTRWEVLVDAFFELNPRPGLFVHARHADDLSRAAELIRLGPWALTHRPSCALRWRKK